MMKPGRELDALVAEKVMGLEIVDRAWPCGYAPDCGTYESALMNDEESGLTHVTPDAIYKVRENMYEPNSLGCWCDPVPFYSTKIEAAWGAVERVRLFEFASLCFNELGHEEWSVWRLRNETEVIWWTEARTAPHAICLAALKTVGVEV